MPKLKKPYHIYLNDLSQQKADKKSMALQYAVGLSIFIIGVILSLPLVPGPGFIFVALGLLIMRVPGSTRLVGHLENKKYFRRFRIWLHLRFNIILITNHYPGKSI